MATKRTVKSIKAKLTRLEAMEAIVKDAIQLCGDLESANSIFINDSSIIDLLDDLRGCLNDNISSLIVVSKLMEDYVSKRDVNTGKISFEFKENHPVFKHGLESLKSSTEELDSKVAKVVQEISSKPFLSSFLRDFCKELKTGDINPKAIEKSAKIEKENNVVGNIDDIFDQSSFDELENKVDVRHSSPLPALASLISRKKLTIFNSEKDSVKLSDVLQRGKLKEFRLGKVDANILLKRPVRRHQLFQIEKDQALSNQRKGNQTDRLLESLPKLTSSKQLITSLKFQPSAKFHSATVQEISSINRERRPRTLIPMLKNLGLGGLMSRQLIN